MLNGKRILLGIGGGIAVYRVAELARLLIKAGSEVRCVMTRSACEFVSPLTFEALTGEKVHRELFDLTSEREMGHIRLARQADAIVIAPATANLIARFANGIADDLLSTIMQVNEAPVLLAPAMNHSMWTSEATRRNIEILLGRGVQLIGPASGELACGESGAGRLAEPAAIIDALQPLLCEQQLAGQHWLINAGPTQESWDAVRILTNRASGSLGAHMAALASAMGAKVTLVAGPGTPATPTPVKRIDVVTARAMLSACRDAATGCDTFVATAAVSDFCFKSPHGGKLKRGNTASLSVEMEVSSDIVAHIAAMRDRPRQVIAFAAETSDLIAHARAKLSAKGVDAIIANDAANMGKDSASGWWITEDKDIELCGGSKQIFALQIIEKIMEQNR